MNLNEIIIIIIIKKILYIGKMVKNFLLIYIVRKKSYI